MVDQTGPRPVPLPGDQIDHVSAVGGAERAGPVAVDEAVRGQRRRPALLQVFQRPVAPVVVDGVGERLSVAGRTVEIDHHHCVSGRGVDLRVPAIGPALGPGRLGPAVDQIDGRIGPALDIADGFEHPAAHVLAVPAGEGEGLGLGQVQRRHGLGVVGRQGAGGLAHAGHDPGRGVEAVAGVDEHVRPALHAGDRAASGQGCDLAGAGVDAEQPVLAIVGGGGEQAATVGGPAQRAGTAIPVGRQRARVRSIGVGDDDHGLIAADILALTGQPGQAASIRREGRRAV